jgi:hypothetical protein
LRAVPSQIRLHLEHQVSREIPVVVRYAAPAPDGLQIVRQQVTPPVVRVEGPASRIQAMDRVQTDPILLGVEMEQTFHLQVFAGDPQVRMARSGQMITVKVVLEKTR